MDGLGRIFNAVAVGDGVYVNLRDFSAVSFLCNLSAGDTYTLTEAKDASGTGAQVLATIDHYYTSKADGSAVWAAHTQAAASTVVTTGSTDAFAVFSVHNSELSDTYTHVKVTSTSTGTVVPILHEPLVQRAPEQLAIVGA